MSEDAKAFGPAAQPSELRAAMDAAVELFDAIVSNVETEEGNRGATIWLTTIECHAKVGASDLRAALRGEPAGNAEGAQALEIARAEGKAEGRREMELDLLAEYQGEHNARHSRRWGIDCTCPLCLRADQLRSLIPAAPGGGGK